MTPDEMDSFLKRAEIEHRDLDKQHEWLDAPAYTAQLERRNSNYTETLWIQGYPRIRRIIVTAPSVPGQWLPGYVRDIPIAEKDMATAETFFARVEKEVATHLCDGWRLVAQTGGSK